MPQYSITLEISELTTSNTVYIVEERDKINKRISSNVNIIMEKQKCTAIIVSVSGFGPKKTLGCIISFLIYPSHASLNSTYTSVMVSKEDKYTFRISIYSNEDKLLSSQ